MNFMCQPFVPNNTCKQTDWAVNVFETWQSGGNGDKCPADLLTNQRTVKELNEWFVAFCC